jgi:hypothetical protein
MAWQVNDEEFRSVLKLPGNERYGYFMKRVASHGELWGLRGETGWVVADDNDGVQHLSVWPHSLFAEACATGPWAGETPSPIDVDEWVEGWLPNLTRDGLRVAVFQTPEDQGVSVAAERLKRDLESELSKFEL